jgi:hypothetical protein
MTTSVNAVHASSAQLQKAAPGGSEEAKESQAERNREASAQGQNQPADSVELSPQGQRLAQSNVSAASAAPTPAANLLSSARSMATSGNTSKALEYYQMIIAKYPNSAEAHKALELISTLPK